MYFSITPADGLDQAYSFVTLNHPSVEIEDQDDVDVLVPCLGFELLKFKSNTCEATRNVEGVFKEIEQTHLPTPPVLLMLSLDGKLSAWHFFHVPVYT